MKKNKEIENIYQNYLLFWYFLGYFGESPWFDKQ